MRVNGVCGWAIPTGWFQKQIQLALPQAEIRTFYPETPKDEEEASGIISGHPADLWIGYSLGSLWLLKYFHLIPASSQLALLCPVPGFTVEMELGGKTRVVQLNYLARSIRKDSETLEPVHAFLKSIEIDREDPDFILDFSPDLLIRGLEFLRDCRVDSETAFSGEAIIGDSDPLMDADLLRKRFSRLIIVPNSGHHPLPLLKALAETLS